MTVRSGNDADALVGAVEGLFRARVVVRAVDAALTLGRLVFEGLPLLIAAFLGAFLHILIPRHAVGVRVADAAAVECLADLAAARDEAGEAEAEKCAKNDRGLHCRNLLRP